MKMRILTRKVSLTEWREGGTREMYVFAIIIISFLMLSALILKKGRRGRGRKEVDDENACHEV
jgi:hypothetical protein